MADDQSRNEPAAEGVALTVDGVPVTIAVTDPAGSVRLTLLDVLRDQLGRTSVKDGCSPQGQCGCCTVLVDGQPRVACVTPARRVAGRAVTTLDGLDPERLAAWGAAFCATGASQCGFCTPGIIVRLDALAAKLADDSGSPSAGAGAGSVAPPTVTSPDQHRAVDQALLAHLCRCTGWQTIHEAWDLAHRSAPVGPAGAAVAPDRSAGPAEPSDAGRSAGATGVTASRGSAGAMVGRDRAAAERRAGLEGGVDQAVGPDVALGRGRFAADTAPPDSLVAVPDGAGDWVLGETAAEARAAAGKVQGRRTTAEHRWPLAVPEGDWAATLRTTWVEPAHLETDASWCEPGGEPYTPIANGGAFGAKVGSPVTDAARRLAAAHRRPVLAIASREDATRWGPKRPPVAGGVASDGTGVLRVVRTPGVAQAIALVAPGLRVEEVDAVGPPTAAGIRAAGWAEAIALLAGGRGGAGWVRSPSGALAAATVDPAGATIDVAVACGPPLDETVLRSYCIGAAHMGWSWLTSEALTVDPDGGIADLTIRSFGVVRAVDTPRVTVTILGPDQAPPDTFGGLPTPAPEVPVNGSDAVFAAVAASGWLSLGCRQDWPVSVDPEERT